MLHATGWQVVTDVAGQCISSIFKSQHFSCTADQPTPYNIPEEKSLKCFSHWKVKTCKF
jgi:hypothetical protein